jgi:immune inhibitor A
MNQARYGRSDGFPCASNICTNVWDLVRDGANAWVAAQLAQGRTLAQVRAELATFDVWDRYDHDDDGDFNEPDGYIDHFQIVHAGGDQADGDPIYGEDAIWSHRSYAYQNLRGDIGPPGNPDGGTPVGDTGIWIGDYTMQPENGGRSVFYHEYGHDLGLPDDYNSIAGGDNNNEHWTLMAQSRLGGPTDEAIGERGGDLGAWNKLQLGWLNAVTVQAGKTKVVNLGPQEYNTNKAQGIVVVLPQKVVTTQYGAPAAGAMQWYSGDGNNLENTMTRQVTLGAGAASLSFQARWDIEDCGPDPCDYAYVEVDDGSGWDAVAGNITQSAEGNGIDGTQATNVLATFDLSAYAGKTVGLRFRYSTDPAAAGNSATVPNGIFIDQVTLTSGGSTILTDGAESGANGWTLAGFTAVGASASRSFDNFYIAGYRSYVGFDQYLKTGPYYFGYQNTRPDFVDHYAYQPGLLISYWDTSFRDNDTVVHPGSGRNLYIDAHPQPMLRADGLPWRARVQVYDAPFSQRRSDTVTLHHNSVAMTFGGLAAQPLFDDRGKYFYDELPNHGVKLPAVGVKIRVLATVGTTMVVLVS